MVSKDNIKNSNSLDEVDEFLNKISNKYSGNADMKYLNQMYDIGIMMSNKNFDKERLADKLSKIIDRKADHPIKRIRLHKKQQLLKALQQGIDDGASDEYRQAYDNAGKYQYDDKTNLVIRARIDAVLNN